MLAFPDFSIVNGELLCFINYYRLLNTDCIEGFSSDMFWVCIDVWGKQGRQDEFFFFPYPALAGKSLFGGNNLTLATQTEPEARRMIYGFFSIF